VIRSIRNKVLLAFGLLLAAVLAVGFFSHRTTGALLDTVHWEVHTHKVLIELHDVLLHLNNAETGQRGYLLTGDERYLEGFRLAVAEIEAEIAALRRLIADNPTQQQRLSSLQPLVAAKFGELHQTIDLLRQRGPAAALAIVSEGSGQRLMEDIRRLVGEMEQVEERLLDERSRRAETMAHQTQVVIGVTGLVAVFCVGIASLAIHRDLARRRRAEEVLEEAHAQLERRVAERTAELGEANSRLSGEIGERKAAEASLRRSYDDMLLVLDRMNVGTAIADAEGRITFLSRRAQQLCGKGEALLGQRWETLMPFSAADVARLEAMARQPQERRSKVPVHFEAASGRNFWMEIGLQDDPHDSRRRIFVIDDISEVSDLRRLIDAQSRFHGMLGRSEPMRRVYRQIENVAAVDSTVLIEGETGTGKELAAQAIHRAGRRRAGPFVAVNCAGIAESLLASELFGHRRGSFTGAVADRVGLFEAADGGTIFLDEIGDLPLAMQTTLLRVLQEREVTRIGETRPRKIDVRVVGATHHDLGDDVQRQRFRADLLYRLRVARVQLPPLRERGEDVALLAASFLGEVCANSGKHLAAINDEAMRCLLAYEWPGNVRELRSAIEFAVIRCTGPVLTAQDLPPEILAEPSALAAAHLAGVGGDEAERFAAALKMAGGNRAAAARLLGISRATFYRHLAQQGRRAEGA